MATEFICKIKPSGQGGDYTGLTAWEAAQQLDLTASANMVFSVGTVTGSPSGTLTLYRGGSSQGVTATLKTINAAQTQVLLTSISNPSYGFQSGDEWRQNASHKVSITDAGDSIISVAEGDGDWSGGGDSSSTSLDGWTTSATNYIIIRSAPGSRHAGVWDATGPFRMNLTGGWAIRQFEEYVRYLGLQIWIVPNGNLGIWINSTLTSGNTLIERCLFASDPTQATAYAQGVSDGHTGGTLTVRNCIAYDMRCQGSYGWGFTSDGAATTTFDNLTSHNCYRAIDVGGAGVVLARNCLVQDYVDDGFRGSFHANSTNNCSDVASDAPGSNSVTGEVTFADEANDDFHLGSGDTVARGAGADLSGTFTDDIDGDTRSAWDIGADEYTSGAISGTAAITLGALLATAAGVAPIDGTSAITFGALTSSSAGTVQVVGTGSPTLGALTCVGAGTVGSTPITGSGAITFGAVTSTAAGVAPIAGAGAPTLGALTASATGVAPIDGTGAITLGALTSSAAGVVPIDGASGITLGALTLSSTGIIGEVTVGDADITLGALTGSGAGTVWVQGTSAPTLGALTSSSAGTVAIDGTGAPTLGALSIASAGAVLDEGSGAVTLGALTLNGVGTTAGLVYVPNVWTAEARATTWDVESRAATWDVAARSTTWTADEG